MQGFTPNVLFLLPKSDMYYGKSDFWKINFKRSVESGIEFAKKVVRANAVFFTSDEVAVDIFGETPGLVWWNALPPEDCNFARRNCDGLAFMPEGLDFEDEYAPARTKYPIKGYLEPEPRFQIAAKREKMVANKLIKKCKLVVSFENQSNAAYKVEKNLNADRAVFIVHPLNFVIYAYYSGQPIDVAGFTGKPWTTMPMHNWEVTDAKP